MHTRTAPPRAASHRLPQVLVVAGLVVAVPFVLIGVIVGAIEGAALLGLVVGVLLGVGVAGAVTVPAWRLAEDRCLAMIPARPADRVEQARLFNVVEGLCAGAGLALPRLFVIPSPSLNAMTLGRDDRHGCLVVTEGLLDTLSRIELEAVLAHELSHLRHGDTAGPTVALAAFGSRTRGRRAELAGRIVARQTGAAREAAADLAGVSLTRYPPGLVAALERVRSDTQSPVAASDALAALWLRAPGATDELDERIEALRDL